MSTKYLLAFLLILNFSLVKGQDNDIVQDSLTRRFIEIIDKFDKSTIISDTSDYRRDYPAALNKNLMIASYNGYCREIARLFIKGADVNYVGSWGDWDDWVLAPIHLAVSQNQIYAAEVLALLGADLNLKDQYGNTPLTFAIVNNNVEMADILISYGASADSADGYGISPLHKSIQEGNFYMTDLLLYYNAAVDIKDSEGNTPLALAVWYRDFEVADILLQAGADPDLADNKGFTPFMIAAQKGDTLLLSLLKQYNANIYSVNTYGYDALCLAVKYRQNDVVNYLLRNGNRWLEERPGKISVLSIDSNSITDKIDLPSHSGKQSSYSKIMSVQPSLTFGGTAANHLALLSGEISFRSPVMKGGVFTSFSFNPVASRILVEAPDAFYQYRMKMRVIEAGVYKEFSGFTTNSKGYFVPYISLSGGYKSYTKYYGTTIKPEDKFCFIPSLGIRYDHTRWSLNSEIRYMKTPFYHVFPIWMDMSLSWRFFATKAASPGKRINLYN